MGYEQLEQFGVYRDDFDVRTDSLVTQLEAIRAGVGIGGAQVPVMEQREGTRRVLPDLAVPALPVWLVVHPDLRHSPTIRVVFDALVDFFGEVDEE